MLAGGARVLQAWLDGALSEEKAPVCGCKHLPAAMRNTGKRAKAVLTILGEVTIRRRRYVCPVCGRVAYPADELLGVGGTSFSPGARRMMAHAGAHESFAGAARDLLLFASLRVGPKDVERVSEKVGERIEAWTQDRSARARLSAAGGQSPVESPAENLYVSFDGTGAPMRREELQGVRGKNGPARTREVKVGCVFTQTGLDEEGRPARDENSTTYVAAIENSVDFGHRIHGEATRRGLHQAKQVIVLSDGQTYNKSIVKEHFAGATHVIDLYHAREHLADFVRDVARLAIKCPWHRKALGDLDRGRITALVKMLRQRLPQSGERRKQGLREIAYFSANAEMMRYDRFRKRGLFIGSGVIEAGCRTIVGKRLKNSGMFWSLRGANAILALRCCIQSNRFEDFWQAQAAA
jgi:hypothetical protein